MFVIKQHKLPIRTDFSTYLYYLKRNQYGQQDMTNKINVREKLPEEKFLPAIKIFRGKNSRKKLMDFLKSIDFNNKKLIVKPDTGSQNIKIIESCDDLIYLNSTLKMYEYVNWQVLTGESCYTPYIKGYVVEHFIAQGLDDYKVFCYRGKAKILQYDSNRFSNHQRDFYCLETLKKLDYILSHGNSKKLLEKETLTKVKSVALEFCKSYEFVRVDLYMDEGIIYLGELTFIPGSSTEKFRTQEMDYDFLRRLKT